MLHLLPIRLMLTCFAALVGLSVLAAFYAGWIGHGPSNDILWIVRWSSSASLVAIILPFAAWRWSRHVQAYIFPHLGGHWIGQVRFQSEASAESRQVTLEIKHNLFGVRMLLESKESTSRTLLVHAERDLHFDRYKLYYAYLNERKEGVSHAGEVYRGLAIIRIVTGVPMKLEGDYFTDTHRSGSLHLTRDSVAAWWQFWR